MSERVFVARCPEHGLHGCRDWCFVCGGKVEQVPMIEATVTDAMVERARLAGERWFHEHDDGASTEDEWRSLHRAALSAALSPGAER